MNKAIFLVIVLLAGLEIGVSIHCMRRARATLTRHNNPIQKLNGGQPQNPKNTSEQSIDSDFPVPASVGNCGLLVRHIRTGGQSGATCGAHTVVNARAIQQIVESGEQLTGQAIRSKAAALNSYIQKENLDYHDIHCLAGAIGLKSHLVIGFNDKMGNFYEASHADTFGVQTSVDDIFSIIQSSQAGDYHFIINTGGHWVLASVIKCANRAPQILYMDSGNGRLAEGSIGALFITYLVNSIFISHG